MKRLTLIAFVFFLGVAGRAQEPVIVRGVTAAHGMVVAGHPEASAAGVAVLKSGGNAIDAAVATSLALGVAEPYGSGLGGKLMLLYFEAKSGTVSVVDAMDAAGSVDVPAYAARTLEERSAGYASACVPGLAAGLWSAHRRWGVRPWAEDVQPAIALARTGFLVLGKSREMFEEQERKLRRGDPDIARLYLPGGKLPEVGSRLANADLARTMETLAREGREGFYRGPVAVAIAEAARQGGGWITRDDLAAYEARITEPVRMGFRDFTVVAAPPPSSGAAMYLPILKIFEDERFDGGPLRSAANLALLGRAWRAVYPSVNRTIGDVPESSALLAQTLAPAAIATLRRRVYGGLEAAKKTSRLDPAETSPDFSESRQAATTHFIVADGAGNIVCATQSQSFHFGAGVIPPGTGVVMNNSMSNFGLTGPAAPNLIGPGKRARSTIGPAIVLRAGKPVFAIGVPGSSRIPSALTVALLERLALNRPMAAVIGDTRIHYFTTEAGAAANAGAGTLEVEASLPATESAGLETLGWKVVRREEAGAGHYFGGINAVECNPDGTLTGFADPRRTNEARGY